MFKKILFLLLVIFIIFGASACNVRQQEALLEQDDSIVADILSALSETEIYSKAETFESVSNVESVNDTASSIVSESVEPTTSAEKIISQPVVSEPEESVAEKTIVVESSAVSSKAISRTKIGQRFVDQTQSCIQAMKEKGDGVLAQENKVHVQKAAEKGKLLFPYSTRSDLEMDSGLPTIDMQTGGAHWGFDTNVSDVLLENELYIVFVTPLTAEEIKTDLRDYFYLYETNKKLGVYNGMEYAYFDGYEGEDRFSSVDTAAWFIRDGYLIKITALYVNNYKPWNNAWFDYFDFETITF